MEFITGEKKEYELTTSPFSDCKICSEVFFILWSITSDHFWCLNSKIESDFGVFQEIAIGNDVLTISFSTDRKAFGKEEISKNWMLEETKEHFRWNKKDFPQFLRASYGEILNNSMHKL